MTGREGAAMGTLRADSGPVGVPKIMGGYEHFGLFHVSDAWRDDRPVPTHSNGGIYHRDH